MYIIYIEADSETASTDDSMDSTIEDTGRPISRGTGVSNPGGMNHTVYIIEMQHYMSSEDEGIVGTGTDLDEGIGLRLHAL